MDIITGRAPPSHMPTYNFRRVKSCRVADPRGSVRANAIEIRDRNRSSWHQDGKSRMPTVGGGGYVACASECHRDPEHTNRASSVRTTV